MNANRMTIYGNPFPNGFTVLHELKFVDATAVRASRAKKLVPQQDMQPGEKMLSMRPDPNGQPYRKGDIILANSAWEIVAMGPVFLVGSQDFPERRQYAIVRAADEKQAQQCRDIAAARARYVMDRAMNS